MTMAGSSRRDTLDLERQVVIAEADRLLAVITCYRAFGGSWELIDPQPIIEQTRSRFQTGPHAVVVLVVLIRDHVVVAVSDAFGHARDGCRSRDASRSRTTIRSARGWSTTGAR